MATAIAGWAHTPFGKYDNESVESLIVRVTNEALAHAGVSTDDVDEIVLGAGFHRCAGTAGRSANCASSQPYMGVEQAERKFLS
jgi:acetyl-CoA acetyltransferase